MAKGIGNKSAIRTSCGVTYVPTQKEASRTLRKVRGKFDLLRARQDKLLVTVAMVKVYEGKIAELEQSQAGDQDWRFEEQITPIYETMLAQFAAKQAVRKIPGMGPIVTIPSGKSNRSEDLRY